MRILLLVSDAVVLGHASTVAGVCDRCVGWPVWCGAQCASATSRTTSDQVGVVERHCRHCCCVSAKSCVCCVEGIFFRALPCVCAAWMCVMLECGCISIEFLECVTATRRGGGWCVRRNAPCPADRFSVGYSKSGGWRWLLISSISVCVVFGCRCGMWMNAQGCVAPISRVAISVAVGSRDEPLNASGISHLISKAAFQVALLFLSFCAMFLIFACSNWWILISQCACAWEWGMVEHKRALAVRNDSRH